jgi:hypothetical protein
MDGIVFLAKVSRANSREEPANMYKQEDVGHDESDWKGEKRTWAMMSRIGKGSVRWRGEGRGSTFGQLASGARGTF